MTERNPKRSFLVQAEVQPPVVRHNYPFGNGRTSENDAVEDETELFELRSRGREKMGRSTSKDRLDDIVFITKEIQKGDTLNSIALQHCCSVADIKRANSFISEQDFFALRSIKIPVKKFSFLTETHFLPKGTNTLRTAPTLLSAEPQSAEALDSISPKRSAGNFLQEVDRDIEQIVKSTDTKRENLNEVVSALSTNQIFFEHDHKEGSKKDPYYGADWGMRWWTAVVIMLVVGIITPVFYLLYYEYLMNADVSHHQTVSQSVLGSVPSQQDTRDVVDPVNTVFDHVEKKHNRLTTNTHANVHRPIT
ncbi:lysM and putative peptidoglycan-binding domain-containing protein 3 [Ambystoma mexicanum]|uniref:lysM and putative peptidoglycan-binding domain-containing protein 3 n=1 Tax=Ambystoma mexicanum TaxID=8296 RepID=UPI0037E8C88B